jgi:hypothetical protein
MADKEPVEGGQKKGGDLGGKEAQAKMDQETAKGYHGTKVDPTPNENYTVAGVTSGKPTPETDPAMAKEAGSMKFSGTEPEPGKKEKK